MNSKPYLTYQEYKELGGTLDIMPFNLLEFEARTNVDKYTFGRLKNLTEQVQEVKMCIYKLIGILASYQEYENQNKSISSESTDGYSISYTQASENASKSKINEIRDIIQTYLSDCKLPNGTPYLYRG
jgi:hypothetical protein